MKTRVTAVVQTVIRSKFPAEIEDFEGWMQPKRILVFLAHPDDPEFFCGATLIRWARAGHEIRYCLFTKGQRGSQDTHQTIDEIAKIRMREQQNAANSVGVKSIAFLDEMDGELVPSLALRKEAAMKIRQFAPQIIVTSDPQNYVTLDDRINHPDHRAAGEIVLGAAFPAAGNPQIYKSPTNEVVGIPVNPEEIWISATNQPNLTVDVSNYYQAKLDAISMHASQIGDKEAFSERMKNRSTIDEITNQPIYVERFKRAILK
jgi:LmbE family N-acetylglucosaminyl deacetylase